MCRTLADTESSRSLPHRCSIFYHIQRDCQHPFFNILLQKSPREHRVYSVCRGSAAYVSNPLNISPRQSPIQTSAHSLCNHRHLCLAHSADKLQQHLFQFALIHTNGDPCCALYSTQLLRIRGCVSLYSTPAHPASGTVGISLSAAPGRYR